MCVYVFFIVDAIVAGTFGDGVVFFHSSFFCSFFVCVIRSISKCLLYIASDLNMSV